MRSWRFLLDRRWLLLLLTTLVLAALAWRLGVWQFHRLDDRKASNAVIRANEDRAPSPVGEVLAPGRTVPDDDEWRQVTATGEYDAADTVVVRYQTQDGEPGVDVVVPLRTTEGPALLVNRGWVAASNRGAAVDDVPAPPSGQVTVTGWVRADDTGSATEVAEGSVRSISSAAIGSALGLTTYGGFVELDAESPPVADRPEPVELPELNNGPHFFYGLQWWFFALLAVFGFGYLAWEERTGRADRRRRERSARPERPDPYRVEPSRPGADDSEGAQQATVDGHHGAGDEARRG